MLLIMMMNTELEENIQKRIVNVNIKTKELSILESSLHVSGKIFTPVLDGTLYKMNTQKIDGKRTTYKLT